MSNFPIEKIRCDNTFEYIKQIRKELRLKKLDSGAYATVYSIYGDRDSVIKIGNGSCDPYIKYVQSLQKTKIQSAAAPIIHSCLIVDDQYSQQYVVHMERLSHSKRRDEQQALDHFSRVIDMHVTNRSTQWLLPTIFNKNIVTILDMCREICVSDSEIEFDLHDANWMFRGEQIVLIDPLCCNK